MQAYLRKCGVYHPDRHVPEHKVVAATAFAAVCRAYQTLSDPVLREEYEAGEGHGHSAGVHGGGAAGSGSTTTQHAYVGHGLRRLFFFSFSAHPRWSNKLHLSLIPV
jgi:DnaJ-class molecular chaperone